MTSVVPLTMKNLLAIVSFLDSAMESVKTILLYRLQRLFCRGFSIFPYFGRVSMLGKTVGTAV